MSIESNAVSAGSLHIPEFNFGDRLRKVRTDSDLDQREFAERIGLTSSTLAAYETGRSMPRARDLGALAIRVRDEFQVPTWWLLDLPGISDHAGMEDLRGLRYFMSPLSDSNRRPPLYIVGGSVGLDGAEWPPEVPKRKQAA